MKPRYRFFIQPKYPPRHAMAGDWAGLDTGTGYEFQSLRRFLPGDSFRHIDWKARARSGKLYVREFLKDSAYNLMLLVDLSPSMNFGGKLPLALDIAGSLAWAALQHNNPCGLLFFADGVLDYHAPSAATRQYHHLTGTLHRARTVDCRQTNLRPAVDYLVKRLPGCLGVILSDFNGEVTGLGSVLEGAAGGRTPAHEMLALHILEQVEDHLPDIGGGHLRIRDMESGAVLDVDLSRREQYDSAMRRLRQNRIGDLAGAGIDSTVILVHGDNVQEKVNTLFARRLAARV
jgi:uncharacterized protein (DUF58 family)